MLRTCFLCALAVACALAANSARATLFYADYFNYPDGNLVNGTNGPNMPSPPFWQGTFASISGQPSAKAKVVNGWLQLIGSATPSVEQPYLPAGATLFQGQTWYAGFDVFLPSAAGFQGNTHQWQDSFSISG